MEPPFRIEEQTISRGPSLWDHKEITIHATDGTRLGSYVRNYSAFGRTTFCPFFLHGRWWALYSPDYTATRVLTLPEAEDWCGEEPHSGGFCPVEYYVPRYKRAKQHVGGETEDAFIGENAPGWTDQDEQKDCGYMEVSEPLTCSFGLVAGCIWADDSSWKIEFLDLSKLPEKILVRDARFGYIRLPEGMSLKAAIDMERWRPDEPVIGITHKRWQDFETGEIE